MVATVTTLAVWLVLVLAVSVILTLRLNEAEKTVTGLEGRLALTNRQLADRVLERDDAIHVVAEYEQTSTEEVCARLWGDTPTRILPKMTNAQLVGLEPMDGDESC